MTFVTVVAALSNPDQDLPHERLSSILRHLGTMALITGERYRRELEAATAARA